MKMIAQKKSVTNVSSYISNAFLQAHPITLNCAYSGLDDLSNKAVWSIYNPDYFSIISLFLQQDQLVFFNILDLFDV